MENTPKGEASAGQGSGPDWGNSRSVCPRETPLGPGGRRHCQPQAKGGWNHGGGSPSVSERRGDGPHAPASPWAVFAGEHVKQPRNRTWAAAEPPASRLPSPGWLSQQRPHKEVGTRCPGLKERDEGGTGEQHCCGAGTRLGRVKAWTWAALRPGHGSAGTAARPDADPSSSGFLLTEA